MPGEGKGVAVTQEKVAEGERLPREEKVAEGKIIAIEQEQVELLIDLKTRYSRR